MYCFIIKNLLLTVDTGFVYCAGCRLTNGSKKLLVEQVLSLLRDIPEDTSERGNE